MTAFANQLARSLVVAETGENAGATSIEITNTAASRSDHWNPARWQVRDVMLDIFEASPEHLRRRLMGILDDSPELDKGLAFDAVAEALGEFFEVKPS